MCLQYVCVSVYVLCEALCTLKGYQLERSRAGGPAVGPSVSH